jgi:4a-hydroxytetrahydrobiopterin dehydratase
LKQIATSLLSDIESLNRWKIIDNFIEKEFLFDDFQSAIDFIVKVAKQGEIVNHHPEIVNSYNKVVLRLTTHDVGGLSQLDVQLARLIDALD